MVKATRSHTTPLPKGLDRLPSSRIRVRMVDDHGAQVTVGTYATRAAAEAARAAAITDIGRDDWIDPALGKITFEQLGEQVRMYRQHDLSERTQINNASLLKLLLPTFGAKAVNKISVRHVDLWWAQQAKQPVNRRNAYFLMSNVLRYEVRWDYIKQSPCQVENAGADASKERPVHTVAEFTAVIAKLDPQLRRAAWVLFGAHLRINELCGLDWRDWDAKHSVLRVERQAHHSHTRETVPTKTNNVKSIKALRPAVGALQEQLREQPGLGEAYRSSAGPQAGVFGLSTSVASGTSPALLPVSRTFMCTTFDTSP